MILVECIYERSDYPDQIKVGKEYWMDEDSISNHDNEEYAKIFKDKHKQKVIGMLCTSHFKLKNFEQIKVIKDNYKSDEYDFNFDDIMAIISDNRYEALPKVLIFYVNDNYNRASKLVDAIAFRPLMDINCTYDKHKMLVLTYTNELQGECELQGRLKVYTAEIFATSQVGNILIAKESLDRCLNLDNWITNSEDARRWIDDPKYRERIMMGVTDLASNR